MNKFNSRFTHNRAQYLAWLRGNAPALYRDCVPQLGVAEISDYHSLSGFWDSVGTTFNTVLSNVTNALPQLANTYSQYQSQRELIKTNTQRAARGQAPLRYENGRLVTDEGAPYTPAEQSLAGRYGNVALIGGLGVIALVLLLRK
jgi:hypothetical protein